MLKMRLSLCAQRTEKRSALHHDVYASVIAPTTVKNRLTGNEAFFTARGFMNRMQDVAANIDYAADGRLLTKLANQSLHCYTTLQNQQRPSVKSTTVYIPLPLFPQAAVQFTVLRHWAAPFTYVPVWRVTEIAPLARWVQA
jgi:hypothetical protein